MFILYSLLAVFLGFFSLLTTSCQWDGFPAWRRLGNPFTGAGRSAHRTHGVRLQRHRVAWLKTGDRFPGDSAGSFMEVT